MKDAPKCRCGCNGEASWLCDGFEYDPRKPDGKGIEFFDEPACSSAADYMDEAAHGFGLPFSRRRISEQGGSR